MVGRGDRVASLRVDAGVSTSRQERVVPCICVEDRDVVSGGRGGSGMCYGAGCSQKSDRVRPVKLIREGSCPQDLTVVAFVARRSWKLVGRVNNQPSD